MPIAAEVTKVLDIPEGVTIDLKKKDNTYSITAKGPKGELSRDFIGWHIDIKKKDNSMVLSMERPRKKEAAMVGTWTSHINNLILGVTKGFRYEMKLVYAHFPVKMMVKDDVLVIENFLGERMPRKSKIIGNTKVQVKGDSVILTGINKEDVGQTMANIEQTTKIKGFDSRVFQDGIYLISKGVDE